MSLPSSNKPTQQSSIRSFFHSNRNPPKYAPPPSSSSSSNTINTTTTITTTTSPPTSPSITTTASSFSTFQPLTQRSSPKTKVFWTGEGKRDDNAPPLPLPLDPSSYSAASGSLPVLPPQASVRPPTRSDLAPLRRINALLLPVSYPDSFYEGAADPHASAPFSRVITWRQREGEDEKVVGGIVCRIESVDGDGSSPNGYRKQDQSQQHQHQHQHNLYIGSLCLLAPYRGMGLIAAALDHIVATARADPTLDVRTVAAHVWTENDDGLHWYTGRGFVRDPGPIQDYYIKLRPGSAWYVRRPVTTATTTTAALAMINGTSANTGAASASVAVDKTTANGSVTAAVLNLPANTGPLTPPPPPPSSSSSKTKTTAQSYQNQRAETEWNDLPQDMAQGLRSPPLRKGSSQSGDAAAAAAATTAGPPSTTTSSRSSSAAPRKKKDRAYPAAAFGGAA